MANSDHKSPTRPRAASRYPRKPTNALGRPYWMLGLTGDDAPEIPPRSVLQQLPATCATLNKAIHALTQILGNSESLSRPAGRLRHHRSRAATTRRSTRQWPARRTFPT